MGFGKNDTGTLFRERTTRAATQSRPVAEPAAAPSIAAPANAAPSAAIAANTMPANTMPANTMPANAAPSNVASSNSGGVAFAGLYLFTLMLYLRPSDLLPIGSFPLVKIVAIVTLIAYVGVQMSRGKALTVWPVEMKMLAVIVLLGVLFTPIAASPQLSIETLTDSFFKVVTVFVLMINLINTRARLVALMKLVVFCGVFVALLTLKSFLAGELVTDEARTLERTAGYGVFFANPNELAMALNLILPFAVVFGLLSKGFKRLAYFGCAAVLAFAVVVSFSRGGFLGLVAIGGVVLWNAGRGRRAVTVLAGLVLCAAFLVAMPSGYSDRLFTILHTQDDQTHSAQERQELLQRAVEVVMSHPVVGVGVGNFGIYSLSQKVAHNSYLEIAAELGVIGFIAYMILLVAPLRTLRRIERDAYRGRGQPGGWSATARETFFLSIGLQAVIVAYMVLSFFQSAEYMWYLYYPVAYAVALRVICANEASEATTEAPAASQSNRNAPQGALWKSA